MKVNQIRYNRKCDLKDNGPQISTLKSINWTGKTAQYYNTTENLQTESGGKEKNNFHSKLKNNKNLLNL